MCTKADEAEIFRFSAFEGAGKYIPYSLGDGTWNITTGAVSGVRNFLPHNIGVGVRSKKRQRKTGSGNKKCFL